MNGGNETALYQRNIFVSWDQVILRNVRLSKLSSVPLELMIFPIFQVQSGDTESWKCYDCSSHVSPRKLEKLQIDNFLGIYEKDEVTEETISPRSEARQEPVRRKWPRVFAELGQTPLNPSGVNEAFWTNCWGWLGAGGSAWNLPRPQTWREAPPGAFPPGIYQLPMGEISGCLAKAQNGQCSGWVNGSHPGLLWISLLLCMRNRLRWDPSPLRGKSLQLQGKSTEPPAQGCTAPTETVGGGGAKREAPPLRSSQRSSLWSRQGNNRSGLG